MSSQPKTATTVRAGAKIDGVSLVPAIVGKGTGVKGVIRGDGGAGDYVITLFDAYAVAIGACAPNAIVQDTGAVPNTGVSTAITQNSATEFEVIAQFGKTGTPVDINFWFTVDQIAATTDVP